MCSLKPGIRGLSDRIRVVSILGRFLEHSRILQFGPPGEDTVWMGSADMMHRNLDRRVEALVRVRDDAARRELCRILDLALSDGVSTWELQADGSWTRRTRRGDGTPLQDFQEELIHEVVARTGAPAASGS
jgi:polyphosphate kinase